MKSKLLFRAIRDCLVISLRRANTMSAPVCYNQYSGDPWNGTPCYRIPPYEETNEPKPKCEERVSVQGSYQKLQKHREAMSQTPYARSAYIGWDMTALNPIQILNQEIPQTACKSPDPIATRICKHMGLTVGPQYTNDPGCRDCQS